jgi:SNF2 family DNA or RNA helicase
MTLSLHHQSFQIYYGPADDPLNSFYIPALSASVRYDRSAGFFSSSALAVAAAGVVRLIQNDGRMRLLVGAQLDNADVDAVSKGYDLRERVTERLLEHFVDPQEALLRRRLEVLAWMVAEGTLEIKVVLPRDERGLPIPAAQAQDYYHPKFGIFTDAEGNRIAFSGSVNESETAWRKNYETFSVYFSWDSTQAYLAHVANNFDRLWRGEEPDWIALDIPQAVREQLLKYRPAQAPVRDPLEPQPEKKVIEATEALAFEPTQRERILFQFVRDAPYLPNASAIAAATSAISPWPHQTRVADAVMERYPDRAMLADEVGLGKTIEAGLVIRQLILSGRVKRCLILAPKSVLKQWQEELYEKFVLNVPRYDAGSVWDAFGHEQDSPINNLWNDFDFLLAGSQLAKRADRRKEILAAKPWDLIVVDEAHHARRRDFKERIYRPNRLLSLLNDLNAQGKATSTLLLTATPMQVHPLEVWDLLTVLGMGGRWGADEDNFLAFFAELRKPFQDIDWHLVFTLVKDYLDTGGQIDPTFKTHVSAEIGPVKWAMLEDLLKHPDRSNQLLAQLGTRAHSYVKELAHHHTPLNRYVFRNTRFLLREYQRRGILHENVPYRKPELKRVPMRDDEQALYTRIEDYIANFYQKYENERRGLGFVMTVYRRRLTSSFYAVRKSLERRRNWLRGVTPSDAVFDDDDTEQEELEQDVSEEDMIDPYDRERFKAELAYVEDFLHELRSLSAADSKLEWLKAELRQTFMQRPTVLVFTQYTDTMDYLRDQLVDVYGTQVACYSGRGGEVWNGIAWAVTTKEAVKNAFAKGEVSVLLCTESASEGLNLQTCGVLINYDMPWNPMRVEQRIGRIDRIGQKYPVVWISNYFYRDTIEDLIYQRLADRIDWFEVVVGDLQPILAEVGEVTRRLAMLPASEREAQLDREIAELRKRLQNKEVESLNLDQYVNANDYQPGPVSPVTLTDLEQLLVSSQTTGHLFKPHPDIPDAYLLTWGGTTWPVTFSRTCFDQYTSTVQFLSYGNSLLAELLGSVPPPEEADGSSSLVRCNSDGDIPLRGWYFADCQHGDTQVRSVDTVAQLKQALSTQPSAAQGSVPEAMSEAVKRFGEKVNAVRDRYNEIIRLRHVARVQAQRARAQRLLIKAALVEIALGQQPELLDGKAYPNAFNEQAVSGLQRHKYPWGPLLQLAFTPGLAPDPDDPYYQQIAGENREGLKGRFNQLTDEAKKMVPLLKGARNVDAAEPANEGTETVNGINVGT